MARNRRQIILDAQEQMRFACGIESAICSACDQCESYQLVGQIATMAQEHLATALTDGNITTEEKARAAGLDFFCPPELGMPCSIHRVVVESSPIAESELPW